MLIIFAAIDNTDKSFPTLAGHPVGLSRMGFSPERKGQAELVRRKAGTVSQKGCSLVPGDSGFGVLIGKRTGGQLDQYTPCDTGQSVIL